MSKRVRMVKIEGKRIAVQKRWEKKGWRTRQSRCWRTKMFTRGRKLCLNSWIPVSPFGFPWGFLLLQRTCRWTLPPLYSPCCCSTCCHGNTGRAEPIQACRKTRREGEKSVGNCSSICVIYSEECSQGPHQWKDDRWMMREDKCFLLGQCYNAELFHIHLKLHPNEL